MQLDVPELSLERIEARVVEGGHDIPISDALSRFDRSARNFDGSYRTLTDEWIVINTSGPNIKTESTSFVKGETLTGFEQGAIRAANEARRLAKMHSTKFWVTVDGKVVGLEP